MKNAATILAENLTKLFAEKGKSANQVGVTTGVGQTTISAWLRKARDSDPNFNPRIPQLESVAKNLGVTVSQLFDENLGRSAKPASTQPHPSPIGTASSSAPHASPLQLSPNAERLVRLVSLIDQLGSASDVLGAAETLLRRTLPNQSTLAYGPPGLQSLFEQYTKDPASLTPDAIATLNRQLVRAAKANTSQEKRDGQRDQSEDTGT